MAPGELAQGVFDAGKEFDLLICDGVDEGDDTAVFFLSHGCGG